MSMQGRRLNTPVFRISFPNLYKPTSYKNSKEEYSVTMIFEEPELLKELKAACLELRQKQWPNKTNWEGIATPFKDGSRKAHLAGYGFGKVFAKAKRDGAQGPPTVVDRGVNVIPADQAHIVYAGAYAIASVHPYTWEGPDGPGMSFNLNNLQFVKNGEPFGASAIDPKADFTPLPPDPTVQAATPPAAGATSVESAAADFMS